jgi:hypothetical protein
MKTLRFIIALFALFIILRGGKAIPFLGNHALFYQNIQYGERIVSVGVVYNDEGKEVMRIPADLIVGVVTINDSELKPEVEM